jgi:hypothetical protein
VPIPAKVKSTDFSYLYVLVLLAGLGSCTSHRLFSERKIASESFEIPADYVEISVEPTLPEIKEFASSIQQFVIGAGDLTSPQAGATSYAITQATRPELYCDDLWQATCEETVGFDPTGYSLGKEVVEFDELAPGFRALLQPKIVQAIQYIYNHDSDYQRAFARILTIHNGSLEAAMSCIAEYMVQRTFSEFSSFPLPCLKGAHIMTLRDAVINNNSLYLENRVRRAVRAQFSKSSEMKQIELEIFPRVRALLIKRVQKYGQDRDLVRQVVDRLNTVQFKVKDCPNFGTDNASYNSNSNTFTLCYGMMLRSRSVFSKVSVVAHELTHALDPCVISRSYSDFKYSNEDDLPSIDNEYLFKNTVACLARESSVGARMLGSGPKNICNSQFGEAFADTMAADILPEYLRLHEFKAVRSPEDFRAGYANVWRSSCARSHVRTRAEQQDVHPRVPDRVNSILAANPKVRDQMACTPRNVPAACPLSGSKSAQ